MAVHDSCTGCPCEKKTARGDENMTRRSWPLGAVIVCCALISANPRALAQNSSASTAATAAGTSANTTASTSATPAPTPAGSSDDLDEIVVHGIRRGDLILPTTVTSSSVYGLDLGVMDVPRNTTVISKAQLDALNIQNPGGFSYLTSSSYADASFGQPNIPRIRGQYGDLFFNGMRDSFTLNGYGAPISFNNVDSIDIVKGPASVQAGPGAGVGGAIDITTKMPSFSKSSLAFNLEGDSQQKRIASVDFGGPLTSNTAARVSLTSNDSGSYYYDMYFHQQSIYAAVQTNFTPAYSVLFTADFVDTKYRENDGVNRVNQNLIDNGSYLTGAPDPSTISGYATEVDLSGATVQLNPRVIIDEPPGTGAHAQHFKAQIIQTFRPSDAWTLTNNTFYDFLNRYNQIMAYYADTARDSFTVENKTDFITHFSTGPVSHSIDAGFTFRFAHVDDVQNYINEPVSVFDLSGDPNSWIFPADQQVPSGAFPYLAAFNHPQYGAAGRNPIFLNDSSISNLQDGAIFLEHRLVFSPQWSVMYGLREDLVQLNYADPLGGADCPASACVPGLPQSASTAWYGLRNGNLSVVYSPTPHVSAYLTYNNAQYSLPNANDGAISTWGEAPSAQLQLDTTLYEAGLKFDLLDKSLFISSALFSQTKNVPTGLGLSNTVAHIKGVEFELNYQPNPSFFATASYSFLHTLLDSVPPAPFYNFPAAPGLNIDGAGNVAVFSGNNFIDPGVPQQLFNVLANYKHTSGFGAQANIQVTGPIDVTQRGYINLAQTNANFANDYGFLGITQPLVGAGGLVPLSVVGANGYYNPPQIPWQFTLNAAVFYSFQNYTLKFSVYNLTSEHNLINDIPYYGNDFLTRVPPRSYDLTFSGRF
jgi:outer membrane receptor protein involved in Fe transport